MTQDLITTTQGPVGLIRLNRPRALHALTTTMCQEILDALEAWRGDAAVRCVMIDHAEGRGFCAGGDIRMLAGSGAGDGAEARAFLHTEYRMNHRLFTYVKDTVAFMDGVTMGGGVGVSQPCRYRVATENTRLAMPETGIGLFPDVGGGWYLSRLPGRIGQYLALTGARLDGAEALALGLATHYLPAASVEAAKARIVAAPDAIDAALAGLAVEAPEPKLLARRDAIDRLFTADDLEEVLATLQADGCDFAQATLVTLATKSPQAMKVSLKLLKDAAGMATFADEMRQEYAVACRVVQRPDFVEGVRALIVDKDNAPRWEPATVEGVSDHMIDRIFAPLPEDEAWTPG
ncbi:enoyl-CoA hydratase/isomerase family protein [Sphingomonas endophytica]|uniref:3-hydroxyisobutyryl-CoA hydrolase n=1 Tax=Sphingomonas endophytica TaxID=869719 RepID=A0ABR6N3L1_9SPHN|nr:enoyl-CoA hydratase/isomerase family protein [Sphingomonas endophytica]MBB5725360.1 enoyl-CoA hydratase [Sphingomonas endophytica]